MDLQRPMLLLGLVTLAWVGWSQLREDAELRAEADLAACRGRACTAILTKKARDLFGYTFTYKTYGESARSLTVTCTRSLWLFGSYRCDVGTLDGAVDERW